MAVSLKGQHVGSSDGDGGVLYLDCVIVNIQVVMLYYSFVRCYH